MMKKGLVKRFAVAAMAAMMMVTAVMPAMKVSANSGTGMEGEKNVSVQTINKEATITADSANIREGAGTSYRVLNTVDKGTKIQITGMACRNGEETGWYQVFTKDKKYGGESAGYIYKSTLSVKGDKNDNNNNNDIIGKRMTVTGTKNYLGLRSEACSDDSKEIARLYNGYTVTVLRTEGKFAYVYSNNLGLEGYVNASFLQ